MVLRFAIKTLGCKVNQYDAQAVAAVLESAGFLPADRDAGPSTDLLVVHTCCVTATAMRKSRQAIRRALRRSPQAAILIAGCYGDYDGRRLRAMLAELNVPPRRVAFAGHHGDVAACVEQFARDLRGSDGAGPDRSRIRAEPRGDDGCMSAPCDARITASPASIRTRRKAAVKANVPGASRLPPLRHFAGHHRAFVKVQDGCDAFCAYCVVPYTRPRVGSRSPGDIVAECRRLVAAGHREIVLCGVFLGAFGRSTAVRRRWPDAPSPLGDLLRRVAGIDGLWRVRLSSIEPGDVTDDLLAAFGELPNAAPHFHLPLQSGSRRILRRMNRQYTAREYRRTVDRVRSALDRPAVTTDVIVGFPGETEEDFAATLDAARHAGFAKIHAFPFSPVEGTAAWTYRHEAAPPQAVRARLARLAELEAQLAADYRRSFVGETMEALVEGPPRRGRKGTASHQAMTDRYLTVAFPPPPGPDDLTGRIVRLHVDAVTSAGLAGTLEEPLDG